jgi:glutathione S-transferase
MITISAFNWVPEFAQGQVRDLRARWALEEAGLPYKTRLLQLGDQEKPDYRALQPFGQVPILEEDGLVLFESGAIVLHIGERSEMLLPKDASGRARATQWLIAALNSIEPFVMNIAVIDLSFTRMRNGRSCAAQGRWSLCRSACPRSPSRSATKPISMVTASQRAI